MNMSASVVGGDTLGGLLALVTDPKLFADRLAQLQTQMAEADAALKAAEKVKEEALQEAATVRIARGELADDKRRLSRAVDELAVARAQLEADKQAVESAKNSHANTVQDIDASHKARVKELEQRAEELRKREHTADTLNAAAGQAHAAAQRHEQAASLERERWKAKNAKLVEIMSALQALNNE